MGTSVGANNLYGAGTTSTSATVSGLPTNGSTVYVRLFSLIDGVWQYNNYTYTAVSNCGNKFQGSEGPGQSKGRL